jgi:hypothetical protein
MCSDECRTARRRAIHRKSQRTRMKRLKEEGYYRTEKYRATERARYRVKWATKPKYRDRLRNYSREYMPWWKKLRRSLGPKPISTFGGE